MGQDFRQATQHVQRSFTQSQAGELGEAVRTEQQTNGKEERRGGKQTSGSCWLWELLEKFCFLLATWL